MKLLITTFILSLNLNASASIKSPAEEIAEYALTCFSEVGVQVGLQLAQVYHSAITGSNAEENARQALDKFNRDISFPSFKAECDEDLQGDEKFTCHSQAYARETKKFVKKYNAENVLKFIPECAYLEVVL
jgi:hypothetical protein